MLIAGMVDTIGRRKGDEWQSEYCYYWNLPIGS